MKHLALVACVLAPSCGMLDAALDDPHKTIGLVAEIGMMLADDDSELGSLASQVRTVNSRTLEVERIAAASMSSPEVEHALNAAKYESNREIQDLRRQVLTLAGSSMSEGEVAAEVNRVMDSAPLNPHDLPKTPQEWVLWAVGAWVAWKKGPALIKYAGEVAADTVARPIATVQRKAREKANPDGLA